MFKKLIEKWKKANQETMEKLNPKPQCDHPTGRFEYQAFEEPTWNELTMSYEFPLVRRKVWRCEMCNERN